LNLVSRSEQRYGNHRLLRSPRWVTTGRPPKVSGIKMQEHPSLIARLTNANLFSIVFVSGTGGCTGSQQGTQDAHPIQSPCAKHRLSLFRSELRTA
jgi:hypothetical protein